MNNLHIPSDEDRRRMYEIANAAGSGGDSGDGKRKWRRGEIEFEALMRNLDNAVSFSTCKSYRVSTCYGNAEIHVSGGPEKKVTR